MLRTGVLRLLRSNVRPIVTSLRYSSTGQKTSLPNVDDLFKNSRRPIEPLVEDPIVVKKFFISEVDPEQMLYPEVISKDELDAMIKRNTDLVDYIETNVAFDGKGIAEPVHDRFKQMKLYGENVPMEFGGRGLTYTETIMASEPEAENLSVAIALNAHRLVCQAINEFGTQEQRSNYLPKLAKGDLVATTAFQEWTRNELNPNATTAEYDANKKQWRLNGTKSFVLNAAKSNLFLVSSHVPQSSSHDSLTVFLVDASAPGVSVHKKDETIGHTDLYQSDVSFKDVYVSSDSMLSVPGSGRHIEKTLMFHSRLQQSVLNLVQMRTIHTYMLQMIDTIEQQSRIENPEGETFKASALRVEASKCASDAYSVESMIYMTVGLMDLYRNTNIDVETAIVKLFSQDKLLAMAMSLTSFIDTPVTIQEHPINRFIRDAIQLQTFGEPKDILKLYVGVAGIQYCGDRIFDDVRKKRNPFFNPEYAIKSFWKEETMDKYESNLKLLEHVVSVFDRPAGWLEASIQRLRIGANFLMTAHGRNLLKEHGEIQRLADTVTHIYASFACLVRANRAWILKLPEAEYERILAGCACDINTKHVKELMEKTENGPVEQVERHYQNIAKQLIKTKTYFPVHPLTRFF